MRSQLGKGTITRKTGLLLAASIAAALYLVAPAMPDERRPEAPEKCPPATVGVHPNCRPVVRSLCPRGTAGVYPNCRPTLRPPGSDLPFDLDIKMPRPRYGRS